MADPKISEGQKGLGYGSTLAPRHDDYTPPVTSPTLAIPSEVERRQRRETFGASITTAATVRQLSAAISTQQLMAAWIQDQAATNEKNYSWFIQNHSLFGALVSDDSATVTPWITVTRSGTAVSSVTVAGPLSFSGDLSVAGSIQTTAGSFSAAIGGMFKDSANGLSIVGVAGSSYNFALFVPTDSVNPVARIATGSSSMEFRTPILASSGSGGGPSYGFSADGVGHHAGIYRIAQDRIGFAALDGAMAEVEGLAQSSPGDGVGRIRLYRTGNADPTQNLPHLAHNNALTTGILFDPSNLASHGAGMILMAGTTHQMWFGASLKSLVNHTFDGGATITSGQVLALAGTTVSGTPTWSSNQAITLSTAAQPNITTMANLTTTGTLASGSIAAGFGNINNASNTLTTGALTATTATLTGHSTLSGYLSVTATGGHAGIDITQDPTGNANTLLLAASTASGAGSEPGIAFYNNVGSSRFALFYDVASDTLLISGSTNPILTVTRAGAYTLSGTASLAMGALTATTVTASASVLSTILDSNAASDLLLKRNGTTKVTVGASNVAHANTISTNAGNLWDLKGYNTGEIGNTLDTTKSVNVNIDGTLVRLAVLV